MPRVALRFAYLGRLFDGYARQPDARLRTVEGVLLDRLIGVGVIEGVREAKFASGSRTDRGVSARQNVCVFDSAVPVARVVSAVSTKEHGLWPLAAAPVADDWDPRRPSWREYRYHLYGPLKPQASREALTRAFAAFVGEHDFTAYSRPEEGRDPMRVVHGVDVEEDAHGFVVVVRGRDFLWRQVRRMVAAALAVATGEAPEDEIVRGLADPKQAVERGTAPAWPLVLWRIEYPGLDWEGDLATSGRVGERVAWRLAHLQAEEAFLSSLAPDRD